MILVYTEDQLRLHPCGQNNYWLLDSWTFHWWAVIVGLAGPHTQTVSLVGGVGSLFCPARLGSIHPK